MNQKLKIYYNQAASLEHLLIATLITSIIISSFFQADYLLKKQLLKIEQRIALLYSKLIADYFLRTNIRNSGYKGSVSTIAIPQHSTINNSQRNYIIPQAPIAICKAKQNSCNNFVSNKILHKILSKHIKPNTTILLVYDVPDHITSLTENMNHPNSAIQVISVGNSWEIGEQLIISDHRDIQRFIISNITGKNIEHDKPYNLNNNFIKKYHKNSEIFRVKHLAFYIAANQTMHPGKYSLYMEDFSTKHRSEAILDHVENLEVTELEPDQKIPDSATLEAAWISSKYLLIKLLIKTTDNNQIFTTGIEIRNAQI